MKRLLKSATIFSATNWAGLFQRSAFTGPCLFCGPCSCLSPLPPSVIDLWARCLCVFYLRKLKSLAKLCLKKCKWNSLLYSGSSKRSRIVNQWPLTMVRATNCSIRPKPTISCVLPRPTQQSITLRSIICESNWIANNKITSGVHSPKAIVTGEWQCRVHYDFISKLFSFYFLPVRNDVSWTDTLLFEASNVYRWFEVKQTEKLTGHFLLSGAFCTRWPIFKITDYHGVSRAEWTMT